MPLWVIILWMMATGGVFVLFLYALGAKRVSKGISIEIPLVNASSVGIGDSKWVPNFWNTTWTMPSNHTRGPGQTKVLLPDPFRIFWYGALLRGLPVQLAVFFTNFLETVDINHRFMQPYVAMHGTADFSGRRVAGAAPETILLDYMTISPLEVPLKAWDNGHYKVAWFSFLNTISPLFPLLLLGLVTMAGTGNTLEVRFSQATFAAVFSFLIVYCGSLVFVWPTHKRLLPRQVNCLVDLMTLCGKSQFLHMEEFDIDPPWMTKEHLRARLFLKGDKYLLGHYQGIDGKMHVGFDVAESDGKPTNLVEWVPPVSWVPRRLKTFNSWFRRRPKRVDPIQMMKPK
jgi:hypothetical protein